MEKAREAMLQRREVDSERPKVLKSAIEADWSEGGGGEDWLRRRTGRSDYWEEETRWSCREWVPALGHIISCIILLAELVLWIQVMQLWRSAPTPYNFLSGIIPCLLPLIVLPGLAVLHSLTRGQLSFKEGLLMLVPPSPILLHAILVCICIGGGDRSRYSRAARVASFVQSCLMSFPLLILSVTTVIHAVLEEDSVNTALLHRYMYDNKFMFFAATISFLNLLISSFRFNERLTGRPVAILVGLPFLFSTILFRLLGFGILFSLFDNAWIILSLGIMFTMSALSVQLSSSMTICSKIFRRMCGDDTVSMDEKKSSIASSLLLSIGGVLLPTGYSRDIKLGHVSGRSWRLILINAIGSLAILSVVISTAILQHIPNTFSGQSLISMIMNMGEMEITIKTGGKEFTMDMPKTQINVIGERHAKATMTLNSHDDMYISYIVPSLLCALVLPFTVLRILLLGWDCTLERRSEEDDLYNERRKVSSGRSCCAVMWSIASLMSFTSLFSMCLGTLVLCLVLMHVHPGHTGDQ